MRETITRSRFASPILSSWTWLVYKVPLCLFLLRQTACYEGYAFRIAKNAFHQRSCGAFGRLERHCFTGHVRPLQN
jgi:hypothetical protein